MKRQSHTPEPAAIRHCGHIRGHSVVELHCWPLRGLSEMVGGLMASSPLRTMPRNGASPARRLTDLSEGISLLPGQLQMPEPREEVQSALHGGLALTGPKRTRFADEARIGSVL